MVDKRSHCIITALVAGFILCFPGNVFAQSDNDTNNDPIVIAYPYNPDANESGAVDSIDLLTLLSLFALEFTPEGITIDGMTLEAYLLLLTEQVAILQANCASCNTGGGDSGTTGGGVEFAVVNVTVNEDYTLTFWFSDGSVLNTPILVGPSGPVGPAGPEGETGPQGEPGLMGNEGPAGRGIDTVLSNADGSLTFVYTDATMYQTPVLTGPAGPPGEPGGPGLPDGSGLAAGTILVWDGTSWVTGSAVAGCMDLTSCNYAPAANVHFAESCVYPDACGVCGGPGAVYDCGCSGLPAGSCNCEGDVVDALGNCGGGCSMDADGDGICDDGDSCVGQADVCGVCNGPGAIYACGCYGIPDEYCDCAGNVDADEDGICDHLDDCVGTPDALGVCNGGCTLDVDSDGICDDNGQDVCFGSIDLCGVCNGPGPIYACGCSEIPAGDCDCAGNLADEWGNCPDYLVDVDGDGLYDEVTDPCLGLETIDLDGYTYGLIAIDGRCWFQENLRVTHYRNGDAIPQVVDAAAWGNANQGFQCAYGNSASSIEAYGLLYNWLVTTDSRQVCPVHFQIPTDADWQELATSLGGLTAAGGSLKEAGVQHWSFPNTEATNASGFSARGGGERGYGTVGFVDMGLKGNWWSSSSNGATGIGYSLAYNSGGMVKFNKSLTRGQSLRCVRKPVQMGCTDVNFLEFDPEANVNDGSCETPSMPGCTSVGFAEYNPVANVDDGSCLNLLDCADEDVVSFQGYEYDVIALGGKCWFQENLRTAYFANGDSILQIQDPVEWANTYLNQSEGWCYYDNNPANVSQGLIYNFFAVQDGRNICPSNWHVATDQDWLELEASLGMPAYDLYLNDTWRGGTFRVGDRLKSTVGWDYPTGVLPPSNPSGFDAVLSGYRDIWGGFGIFDAGGATFWTSTPHWGGAYARVLKSDYRGQYAQAGVLRQSSYYFGVLQHGHSVRCVRD